MECPHCCFQTERPLSLQELEGTAVDLGETRRRALQSPGVNRSLLLVTLERCFQLLGSLECVDVLGRVLRGSSASLLQPDIVDRLPGDLGEDAFKNLWVTLPIALHPTRHPWGAIARVQGGTVWQRGGWWGQVGDGSFKSAQFRDGSTKTASPRFLSRWFHPHEFCPV